MVFNHGFRNSYFYVRKEILMRKKMERAPDKQVFRRTAVATKRINISPIVYRGGIRL